MKWEGSTTKSLGPTGASSPGEGNTCFGTGLVYSGALHVKDSLGKSEGSRER